MSKSKKEKYDPPNPRRSHTIMSTAALAAGKNPHWAELEITGIVCNLSPKIWELSHLTSLYLNGNNLTMIPPDIARLSNLMYLDLSFNQLHSLPSEIGDLFMLRELLVNNNNLRNLPLELGKLFQLLHLGLSGNPLSPNFLNIYQEPNGTSNLIQFMLNNLSGNFKQSAFNLIQLGTLQSANGGGGRPQFQENAATSVATWTSLLKLNLYNIWPFDRKAIPSSE